VDANLGHYDSPMDSHDCGFQCVKYGFHSQVYSVCDKAFTFNIKTIKKKKTLPPKKTKATKTNKQPKQNKKWNKKQNKQTKSYVS